MTAHVKHPMARRRLEGPTDVQERDAFARKILDRAKWPLTREGRARMDDKDDDATSVAYQAIRSVLDLGQKAGMNPLQLVQLALRGHNAHQDDNVPEIMEVVDLIGSVLDRADAAEAGTIDGNQG